MMKRFNDWIERNERAAITLVLLMLCLMVIALLSGCFSEPRGPLPPESAAEVGLKAQLESIGGWFVYIGLLAFGLGLVARLAGTVFVPVLAPFASIFGDIAECGIVAALVGGLLVWLSANFWVLLVACILAALAWAWWRRAAIRRWVDRIKAQAVKP